ncbi:MAG: R2-like ligand-binding oxidase [Chloroflexi bacterium]|nr:R2-like ligand-binding oxidase [Chloroflexota bacterium]
MPHESFVTTSRGLDYDSPPMRLYEKAKRLGVWNPSDINLSQDILDWEWLKSDERDLIVRLIAMFQAGEEAVTLDLLPLLMTVASENRLEEEMFLTTFLWEEAKHTDFFHRFMKQVTRTCKDLSTYHTPNYRTIFYKELPKVMQRLRRDSSPRAQAQAVVTYNMIVEGVLAETGYHAFSVALEKSGWMPGLRKGIALLKQDEARHIAYGIYLLSRLVAENPNLWAVIETKMNELLMPAIGLIGDAFVAYDPIPFGLKYDEFANYASQQFANRLGRLERARGQTIDEINKVTQDTIEQLA